MLHRGKCCWKNITIDTATHDTCVWDVVSVKKKPTLHCQSVDWFLRDFFKSIFFETVEYDKLMYITGRNFEGRTVRNLIFEYFWGLRKKTWNQYQYLILQQWSFRCSCHCLSVLVVAYMVVLWLFYVYKSKNLFNSFNTN